MKRVEMENAIALFLVKKSVSNRDSDHRLVYERWHVSPGCICSCMWTILRKW